MVCGLNLITLIQLWTDLDWARVAVVLYLWFTFVARIWFFRAFNESLAHYCLFSTKRTVEISTFHINLALQFPAFYSFKIWQISWVGVLPRSAIANSKNCKTVIGDCLYQFINPSRAFRLPPVILMNTPTSELFFLKHCETAGKLTLLLKGFGLDRYFPQLYSFRIQKMSWENWPWDL